jgi:hypothetical protein
MGTWGAGNFDSDNALDYMSEVEEELIDKIEARLADEEGFDISEDGDGVVMPTLEMLSVLHEHCRLGLPEVDTVRDWKERYLAFFDDQIDGYDPQPGYKEARRTMIEATFMKLEAQAWDYEKRLEEIGRENRWNKNAE